MSYEHVVFIQRSKNFDFMVTIIKFKIDENYIDVLVFFPILYEVLILGE